MQYILDNVSNGSGIPWLYQNCGTVLDSLDWDMRIKTLKTFLNFWQTSVKILKQIWVSGFSVNVCKNMWWYASWKKISKCLQKYVSKDFCHIRELQLEVYVIQNSVKISENSIENLEILLNLSSFFRNLEYSCSLMESLEVVSKSRLGAALGLDGFDNGNLVPHRQFGRLLFQRHVMSGFSC